MSIGLAKNKTRPHTYNYYSYMYLIVITYVRLVKSVVVTSPTAKNKIKMDFCY